MGLLFSINKKKEDDPAIWGPPLWDELHRAARNFSNPEVFEQFLIYVSRNRLPCGECKEFFDKHVIHSGFLDTLREARPADIELFFYDFHNKVNTKLGKKRFRIEEYDTKYTAAPARPVKNFVTVRYGVAGQAKATMPLVVANDGACVYGRAFYQRLVPYFNTRGFAVERLELHSTAIDPDAMYFSDFDEPLEVVLRPLDGP